MKAIPLAFAIALLAFFYAPRVFAQGNTSNKGTEFWTVWMDHINGAGTNGSQMNLYITADASTTGTITVADGTFSTNFTVTANQVTTVAMPASAFLDKEGFYNKGIHITSAKNIVVYAHIYYSARSGATLVLPVNAMGKDYYSLNYTQTPSSAYSTFCVVGTEDNTTVEITPTATLTSAHTAGTTFTISLQKGQVYQGLSSSDLTGTRIKSVSSSTGTCKKIAVYSGSTWVQVSCTPGKTSADNFFQQVYPTSSWGKNYITAPLSGRAYDVYRIVYSDPTAKVTLNGTAIPAGSLVNNFYYEFKASVPNVISSDKPIQVIQYASTQGTTADCGTFNESIGDPEMIYLSPIEQGLDHVTLYSTDKQNIVKSFINVILPSTAVSSFKLDGASYTSFTQVPGNAAYSYAQIQVASGAAAGTHNISASSPFNAIAYGFGNIESYGYAAGTDLKNLNEFIEFTDSGSDDVTTSGCTSVNYKLRISIPYQTTKIIWNLNDGNPPVTVNNPTLKQTVVKNGQTLYVYEYDTPVHYSTAGNYSVIATVLNPTADDCGSNEDIEFDFTISDVPATSFTAPASACINDNVAFTDKTDTKSIATKTWAWNFGDATYSTAASPNTATTQNATHTFTHSGNYTVTLNVTNQNGCVTGYQQQIHLNAPPIATFNASVPDCETRNITFTDASTPGEGTLNKWEWNFGDGTTEAPHTSATAFTHQFATAGIYKVTLTVTSTTGCTNSITNVVTVNPLPQVDFTLPDACVNDNTLFTDKSTIVNHTEAQFTYAWNFGDPTSGASNTSAQKNPQHHFTHAGDFTVTLTVTSATGCSVTKTQAFTVNGDTPKADFEVQNTGSICSADDVLFLDKSVVNFGNVTKLVWYFDVDNRPTQSETFTRDQFPADRIYRHNYGVITTATTYNVKLVAYSGDACISLQTTHPVTVKPSPVVTLAPVAPLCQEDSPVQIQYQTQNGVTGTPTFSGTGVSSVGSFNPMTSGAGTFTINFNYVASNQCTYSSTLPITVYANPVISVASEFHVLEGGQVPLKATATGDGPLTYKWTLSNGNKVIGLDRDDVAQPTASPSGDITYLLTVTSANNCSKSTLVTVTVLKAPLVPNTFTPNNDGINDIWDIKYLDSYPNCTIDVYNRFGEKLYSSIGYAHPWDGTYRGMDLPVGTYYYIINPKNGRKVISGSVTIIR